MVAQPDARFLAIDHPERIFEPTDDRIDLDSEAFALRRGDPGALNFFDNWMPTQQLSGWLEERHHYWFGSVRQPFVEGLDPGFKGSTMNTDNAHNTRPRLAMIPGDANGIGPELLVRLLARPDTPERADILIIADPCLIARGERDAGCEVELREIAGRDAFAATEDPAGMSANGPALLPCAFIDEDEITPGEISVAAGRATLRTLDIALEAARDGVVDGILFAPFNKQAMIAAGLGHEDELHYMAEFLGHDGHASELNVMGDLWTSRVTSHVALKEVAGMIGEDGILDAVRLVHDQLRMSGVARPRIGVCALNPHAGDGGAFGMEEIEVIAPAVERACSFQFDVSGPWPADTVFLKATAGDLDAVVTMYHDQGQIAMKLLGFDKGITVQGGLPVPVTTPAHGTAYDISGAGRADPGAIQAAFELLLRMTTAGPSFRVRV